MKVGGAAANRFGAVYGRNKEKVAQSLITEDVRRGIRQLRELEDRFLNGSADPRKMRGRLQDLIEGKFSYDRTPWWYHSPENQVKLVRMFLDKLGMHLWPIPDPPEFHQQTETEILMLCIYFKNESGPRSGFRWTIAELGKRVSFASPSVKLERPTIWENRITRRARPYRPGVRWVAVDLEANQDVSVSDYVYRQKRTDLADVEVVMAAYLFNEWVYSWDGINTDPRRESVPRPALGNLMFDFHDEDFGVPVFDIEEHHDKEDVLKLKIWVDHTHKPSVCLPTVRELT